MMNIIPFEKWLSTEHLGTNTVALLFWSDWHTLALGCLFPEEYGEAMLSRLLMRSEEVGNAQSVQQTTNIFLTLPPTLPGEKKSQGVLTQKSVDKYTNTCACSFTTYHMPGSPFLLWKRISMWSNVLMKPPACTFPECCHIKGLQSSNF